MRHASALQIGDFPFSGAGEEWHCIRQEGHWYAAAADFSLRSLGDGPGSCLVIGSAPFEKQELSEAGWSVTYLDWRNAPFVDTHADACAMPFADASFDTVSSTCVLCHVGLGRYGDPHHEDAERKMLHEIWRVSKPHAQVALTLGPVAAIEEPCIVGDSYHRAYTRQYARDIVLEVGFRILQEAVWDTRAQRWRREDEPLNIDIFVLPDYLSLALEKT